MKQNLNYVIFFLFLGS